MMLLYAWHIGQPEFSAAPNPDIVVYHEQRRGNSVRRQYSVAI